MADALVAAGLVTARLGRSAQPSSEQRADRPSAQSRSVRSPTSLEHTEGVRITIRVRPGSARPGVGGDHGGALVVRVSARAVDGRATAAALAAVAEAFGVRPREVTLVAGSASRTKIVDVAGADHATLERLLHS